MTATYEEVLRRIEAEQLQTNVSVKPTHLGVVFDEELVYANIERLVAEAGRLGNFVRIDMEDTPFVDVTLGSTAGCARPATTTSAPFSSRTSTGRADDLESLLPLEPNLRIVKGAYKEPADVAYPKKTDVDASYDRLVARSIAAGGFTAVATHDEARIDHALSLDAGPDRMELQMLYGVRPQLQLDLVRRGQRVLVATPYGPDWYPYLMRRLAERPANLLFFAKNALGEAESVTDRRFAEPGVAFVHRPDQPSACAYRLLGSASTYSGPVLGAPGDYGGGDRARKRAGGRKLSQIAASPSGAWSARR